MSEPKTPVSKWGSSTRTAMNRTTEQAQNIFRQVLLRRGFDLFCCNPKKNLLLPAVPGEKTINDYYRYLTKYSFRLFLRDIISLGDSIHIKDLQNYSSANTILRYLQLLLHWNIIAKKDDDIYQIIPTDINSFGDTFEWFIAQTLIREFYSPAAWGIRIKDSPSGGDYDVISLVEGALLYVEAKSSPPKHIDSREVSSFLDRTEDLRPHFALFLEDTHLRMKDKIAEMFDQELKRRAAKHGCPPPKVRHLERELFMVGQTIFIINSKPDIVTNIGTCIRHFLRSKGTKLFPQIDA